MTMTDLHEPTSFADAISSTTSEFRRISYADPDAQPHPFDGQCKKCGCELDHPWRQIDHPKAPGWYAVNACDRCYEATKTEGATEGTDKEAEWWLNRCPPEFRRDWDNRLGSEDLFRRVMAFDLDRRRGLLIVGRSGSGKTRAVWQLLRRLTEDSITWYFATALEVMEGLPAEAYKTKVLVIDDLGNDPLTMTKEVTLLKVIRQRVDWHQPLIVTTQFKGEELSSRFSERATAQAIVRRLREFCDPINIDQLAAQSEQRKAAQYGNKT